MAWPPMTLATIGSLLLRLDSAEVRLIDGNLHRMSPRRLLGEFRDFPPDVVIVTTSTPTYFADARSAAVAREANPEVIVVMIGPHASARAGEIITSGEADIVIRNEPELVAASLIDALLKGLSWRTVDGIAFRENGDLVSTPSPGFIPDLNLLPFPERALLANQDYVHPLTGRPFAVIQAGRGCPYECTFCCEFYYGSCWRTRAPELIVDEMQECVETLGIHDFLMHSNNFTFSREHTIAFCRELRERGLPVAWTCTSRVDAVDDDLLAEMRRAGCAMITYGIESGDGPILAEAGKGISPGQSLRAVDLTKKHGIASLGHFLFGLPGETRETAEANIRFALDLNPDYAEFLVATPYPGTKLSRYLRERGHILSEDWARYDETCCDVYVLPGFEPDELAGLVRQAYRRFYLRPGRMLREIFSAWNSAGLRGMFSLGSLFWQRHLC